MAMPSQPDPRPEEETVRYDIADGVAWVYFNRPDKRNCMNPKLNRRMLQVLTELEFRDDVQVLVLTGDRCRCRVAWAATPSPARSGSVTGTCPSACSATA